MYGVLKTCFLKSPRFSMCLSQADHSATQLLARSAIPLLIDLVVSHALPLSARPWSEVRHQRPSVREFHYHWRLRAMESTRFFRTLFLDNDVFVVDPDFARGLLVELTPLSDVAMPLDPDRRRKGTFFARTWAPPVCAAVMSYSLNGDVRRLLTWARGLLTNDTRWSRLRRTDQEALYLAWTEEVPQLRLLILPEETYCPSYTRSIVTWKTSWRTHVQTGTYPCRAIHGPRALASPEARALLNITTGLHSSAPRSSSSFARAQR